MNAVLATTNKIKDVINILREEKIVHNVKFYLMAQISHFWMYYPFTYVEKIWRAYCFSFLILLS